MATTYKWIVSSMDSTIQETIEGKVLDDIVNTVHWRRSAQTADYDPAVVPQVGYYVDIYGSLSLDSPDPDDFTLYDSLTEAEVDAWLVEGLDVSELKTNLDAQLALLINPVDETKPLPWVSS